MTFDERLADSHSRVSAGTGNGADFVRDRAPATAKIGIGTVLGELLWQNGANQILVDDSHAYFVGGIVWLVAAGWRAWVSRQARARAARAAADALNRPPR